MRIIRGDCVKWMRRLSKNSVDAIVTDPPYGLSFMGKDWDSAKDQAWHLAWAKAALRVLKPGGHLLAFGGTRTYHRLACAVEDAGFEVRDMMAWMYGTGFPKSLNLPGGLGTALKPAHEPIVVARKPLAGTVAANVLEHGTGALNIDACRIPTNGEQPTGSGNGSAKSKFSQVASSEGNGGNATPAAGRWPANVLLDEEAGKLLDEQSGQTPGDARAGRVLGGKRPGGFAQPGGPKGTPTPAGRVYSGSGGASRFFYCAKSSTAERNRGLDGFYWRWADNAVGYERVDQATYEALDEKQRAKGNVHPTVKPISLMRYLVRLVTPKGGVVLDPFVGSGTTAIACIEERRDFIMIEREKAYKRILRKRIRYARRHRRKK